MAASPLPGVVLVLPEWGGGKGGVYSLAHNLMHQLRGEGHPVRCVLGVTLEELSVAEREHIQQLGVEILGPELDEEDNNVPAEERIVRQDLFQHVVPSLTSCNKIISTSRYTHELATWLMHHPEAIGCDLFVLNPDISKSQGDMTSFIEAVWLGKAVFSIGYRVYENLQGMLNKSYHEKILKHHLLIPDYRSNLSFESSVAPTHPETGKRFVFIPRNVDCDEYITNCIASVEMVNETVAKDEQPEYVVQTIIQRLMHDQVLDHMSSNCHYISYSSHQEVEHAAMAATLILASGQMNGSGYSGLEFLANSFMTLVPEGSDVAKLLTTASPQYADLFILKMPRDNNLSDWKKRIHDAIVNKSDLEEKLQHLLSELHSHISANEGWIELLKLLKGKNIYKCVSNVFY